MRRLAYFLFYLLLLLLPTQLGRHFFPDFAFVAGVRSDYLEPTIYLTDIIIIVFIISTFSSAPNWQRKILKSSKETLLNNISMIFRLRSFVANPKRTCYFGVRPNFTKTIICFSLLSLFISTFFASDIYSALYKDFRIVEFGLLGFAIYLLQPTSKKVLIFLSLATIYICFIAYSQIYLQHAINGILYFLGERNFSVTTPGIATFSLNGAKLLRPYATFPHPNVLGGFLAVVLVFIIGAIKDAKKLGKEKFLFGACLIMGTPLLLLTFSRSAWLAFLFGLLLIYFLPKLSKIKFIAVKTALIIYLCALSSIILPLIFTHFSTAESYTQRVEFMKAGLSMWQTHFLFGVGPNNFLINLPIYLQTDSQIYFFQPIHNIYLLWTVETGFIGLIFLLLFIYFLHKKSWQNNRLVFMALTQLFILGFFDHYLLTLQQGQLLFTLFASLAFYRQNA